MPGGRRIGVALLVALAGVLSACSVHASVSIGSSELSASKMAAIVTKVTRRQGFVALRVSCPSGVGFKTGRLSYCTAHYADGASSRFVVRQTNDNGNVYVRPAEMTAPAIENDIRVALRRRGITATARCPSHVAIVVGQTFTCNVRDSRQTGRLPVKITDANGGYVLGMITVRS